jgi:hypothetical protein
MSFGFRGGHSSGVGNRLNVTIEVALDATL